jgi:hypothetical protein
MKLEIEYNIKDGQKAIISTEDDMYGCRTLILPSPLAIKIYEALTEEWTM